MPSESFGPAFGRSFARSRVFALISFGFTCIAALVATIACSVAHDDGGEAPAAGAARPWPRITAKSEVYELVGILKGDRLTIYVDRLADNEPVVDASVTVWTGEEEPIEAASQADGTYTVASDRFKGTGPLSLAIAVTATCGEELLAGILQRPEEQASAPTDGTSWTRWKILSSAQNPALLSAMSFLLGILAGHFFRSGRIIPATMTAAGAVGVCALLIGTALGHGGSDGAAASPERAVISDAPRRLADGGAFVAKPTQRLLEIRTTAAKVENAQAAVNLIGRVIADPNRTSLVQSIGGGRVMASENGLPHIGQIVTKGDVLAEIERSLPQADRTNISEKTAEIEQLVAVTEARLARIRQLAERGVALQSLVVEAELDLAGLRRRREVIREARVDREVLRAPTSGLVAAANVVPGQVVQAQDILFQIVDPNGLWVEALVFGGVAPKALANATITGSGRELINLVYRGSSPALRQQAALVHFGIPDPPPGLSIGQPVSVTARTGSPMAGIVMPRDAVVRSGNGESIVWLHDEFEDFDPRPVRTRPLDATRVIIASGVKEGERIVVRGADLVNQIR
jgi:RND family efflux transporter MFP subunit